METKALIYLKLEDFIKKFYTNELLKGGILFMGLGLLYFLAMLLMEYFLWLNPFERTLLFWTFIGVALFLFVRFIAIPLFRLFKLQKGMNHNQAAILIGRHFSEVNDTLTNFLQLATRQHESELLLASIEQKAKSLQPVPFSKAIRFSSNQKYLPWLVLPLVVLAVFVFSGHSNVLAESMNRVVRYTEHFSPPAPFAFVLKTDQLVVEKGEDFVLQLKTVGKLLPEKVLITLGSETYFMESTQPGTFEYRFEKVTKTLPFYVSANAVRSPNYALQVIETPSVVSLEMRLQFPSHVKRKPETVQGSGNAIVPEGTRITWNVVTEATTLLEWSDFISYQAFSLQNASFKFHKTVFQNTAYQVLTSNANAKHYEKLNYQISTIKDQYPTIVVTQAPDSLRTDKSLLIGQVADDYGLTKLQLVYYPEDQPDAAKKSVLRVNNDVYDQFVYSFPSNLALQEGVTYTYYFEIFDNDALHQFKSAKSAIFSTRISTQEEQQDQLMQQKNENISGLSKSIKSQEKNRTELEELKKLGKENKELLFKDRQKISDFIKRQKQQEQMMNAFSKKLEDNLKAFKSDNDPLKKALEKRMENAQKEAQDNEKALDELQKLTEKLQEEELFDKLDKFKQRAQNQSKNLAQLVELTKRYYVQKKAEQLTAKLTKLADKQERLAMDAGQNKVENQKEINKAFENIQEQLRQLEKDNKGLKQPLDLPSDQNTEQGIKEDMQQATDALQKNQKEAAQGKQKKAADKMKQLSQQMSSELSGGEMEQLDEDIKMMRQILDNLLAFSFSQETVMKQFKGLQRGAPTYNTHLKKQQDLKLQFKHIDDSLFAMSLRNPMITERITEEIGNVHYNVDRSLEVLAEAIVSRGVSHQQYAISVANRLADFLSDVLSSMQMQAMGMGKGMPKPGQGQGGQLPDIIQKQQGLGNKIKEGMEKGAGKEPGKEGDKGATKGEKSPGQGNDDGEDNAKELMALYKAQRLLREQLQDALEKQGLTPDGQRVLNQMKDAEKQILNKGFKNEVFQKILAIKQEMLQLEKAIQEQGDDTKRTAQANTARFNASAKPIAPAMQEYLNSIEILNRQTLPLRPSYNKKVQDYFNRND